MARKKCFGCSKLRDYVHSVIMKHQKRERERERETERKRERRERGGKKERRRLI